MAKLDLMVSVVAVLENHAAILPALLEELSQVLDAHYTNYELLLVDNGSTDATGTVVAQLLKRYKCFRYLRLTRRADDETALIAGLDASIGDYVVTLHPDYDPPGEIPAMVETCRTGSDVVIGQLRQPIEPGLVYRSLRSVFFALSRRIVNLDFTIGTTGFRAMSRQAVNALVKVRLRRRYFAVVAADIGLTTVTRPYDRISRSGQRAPRSLPSAVQIGVSVLIHNSINPLRLASGIGLMGSVLSLLYSLYVVLIYLFKQDVMPGWTTLSLTMSVLFSLAFLMFTLMGEYLGRLLEEVTDRPLYHVRDEQSSAVMLADMTRRNVLGHAVPGVEDKPAASSDVVIPKDQAT